MNETDSHNSPELAETADGGGMSQGSEPWLRFAVIFGVLAVASELFYYALALDSDGFKVYLGILAKISGAFLRLFDGAISVEGTRITGDTFVVEIAEGCDAIQVCSLLIAAVVAFPVELKSKLRGMAVGVLALQIFNLMRIVTLFWIGDWFPSVFRKAHEIVWPGILITITIVFWVLWVRWETGAPQSNEHAA